MIEWLSSNIPNILIVAAVISACAAVIVHEIKMKRKAEKSGGSYCPGCPGNCSGCNVHHRVEREEK
ncbi:MAG: FeoB-associated Cys-rich membrane protein [Clostridiales bacterium]|nr:FeoB-associated Cys-rich membrane protein [Clostridiales bacterium]